MLHPLSPAKRVAVLANERPILLQCGSGGKIDEAGAFVECPGMSLLQGLRGYYSLFGYPGVLLTAKARMLHRCTQVAVTVPGLKHPVYLRLRTSDVTLFRSILLENEYDWPFAKSPRVIVDAGANVGFTSVFYATKYPEAKIIAIEPEPSNFAILRRNIAPYPNVEAIQAALWKESEDVHIVDSGLGCWAFQVRQIEPDGSVTNCRTAAAVTVDTILSDLGLGYIDILKLDIEGSEREVFEHSATWIERVGVIVIEFHDHVKTGCSQAVYRATRDFELEWRRGETTILLRKGYAQAVRSEPDTLRGSQVDPDHAKSALPLEITEVELFD
jgi:FkbM family methyltransferase